MNKQAQENLKYTLATHAAERMKPSTDAVQLCRKISDNRLSADAAVRIIQQKYGVERRN